MSKSFVYGFVVIFGGLLFPFRTSFSAMNFQLILLPLTFVYLYSIRLFFLTDSDKKTESKSLISSVHPERMLLVSILVLVLMGTCMLVIETRMFSQFGYVLSISHLAVVLIGSFTVSAFLFLYRKSQFLPWAILISLALIYLYSIQFFPLHPARSDMLLLIKAASERFLQGSNPYIEYTIFHPVMLTYLPGMWLSYVPAAILGIDLRYVNLILLLVSAGIFLRGTSKRFRLQQSVFAAIFFLNPWLIFRHEIYLPVFIFQMVLIYQLYVSRKTVPSMIVFAWTLASYQFSWVLFPLYLALVGRQYGKRTTLKALCIGATGFSLFLVPFLVISPEGFFQGVFGTWKSVFQVETFNLSYWIIIISSISYIKLIQVLFLLVFYVLTLKRVVTPAKLFKYATWCTVLFILTGQLIWHYFLIMPAIHMLYYVKVDNWGAKSKTVNNTEIYQFTR